LDARLLQCREDVALRSLLIADGKKGWHRTNLMLDPKRERMRSVAGPTIGKPYGPFPVRESLIGPASIGG
jgi:hypothetical protein